MYEKTLTFEDAVRLGGPLSFNLMVKPVGSLCNLGCTYCYYLDKADIYGGKEPRMDIAGLERYVKTFIESCEVEQVTFNWHGGEPLVAGIDFYRKAVEFQKRYGANRKIINTIQTNGTLINPEWARFFKEEDFLVGVSIDGPMEIHDAMRRDRGGKPTFDRVVAGIECLYRAGAQYNLMTAVNRYSEGHAIEIYRFLKTLGTPYIQFLPVAEQILRTKGERAKIALAGSEGAQVAPWSISGLGYGKFLCQIYDEWLKGDVGRIFVNVFDATLAGWCGVQPGSCVFGQTCGGNAVMEHNGDIYPCDHFVYPGLKLGNLYEDNLKELMQGKEQVAFGLNKRNSLPGKCLECKYLHLCNGECPKHRFGRTQDGKQGLNVLCEGYRMFFRHSEESMLRMRQMLTR